MELFSIRIQRTFQLVSTQKAGKTTINLVPFQIYHDKNYSLKNGIRRTVFLNNIDWQNVHLSNNATIYKANCFCLHPTTPLG